MLNKIIRALRERKILNAGAWSNRDEPERMEVREAAVMASEPYWLDAIVAHDDAAELPIYLAEAMTTVERDRLRAYARVGELICRIARNDIDKAVARAIQMIETQDQQDAWK